MGNQLKRNVRETTVRFAVGRIMSVRERKGFKSSPPTNSTHTRFARCSSDRSFQFSTAPLHPAKNNPPPTCHHGRWEEHNNEQSAVGVYGDSGGGLIQFRGATGGRIPRYTRAVTGRPT